MQVFSPISDTKSWFLPKVAPRLLWKTALTVIIGPILLIGCTFFLRQYLVATFAPRPLTLLFVLPILLSAYFFEVRGGLFATVLSGVGVALFPSPANFLRNAHPEMDYIQWLCFWITGLAICLIVWRLRRFQDLARRESAKGAYFSRLLDLGADVAGLGIYDHDLITGEIQCSSQLRKILGVGEHEKVYYDVIISRIVEEDRASLLEELVKSRDPKGDGRYSSELRIIKPDGSIRWIKIQAASEFEGDDSQTRKAIRRIGTMIDITEQRNREELTRASKTALEQMNHQLKCSNEELEHFAAVAAHDLGSPLKSIRSWIDILEQELPQSCDQGLIRAINYIKSNANRADALICDLLDISRVQSNRSNAVAVNLEDCVHSVLKMHAEQIKASKARVTCEKLPTVYGTNGQLESLFSNLLRNALIYKRPGTSPDIVIGCLGRDSGFWEVFVSDKGIGIKPEDCPKIFEIFKRLHSSDDYPGTGIGLAICKKIVELNGGKLWVNSQVGQGSVFRFTYPKAKSS